MSMCHSQMQSEKKMKVDPKGKTPDYVRVLISKGGGITQLSATINEDAFVEKDSCNEGNRDIRPAT